MVGFLLLLLVFLAVVVVAVYPKLGAILVWPILYVYPHLYLYRLDLMPWNIGIDDLFICALFLAVLVRRNLSEGIPFRIGLSVVGASTYFVVWSVAHLSGWTIMPELLPVDIVKPILKGVIFVMFTFALVHIIDDERDLRRAGTAFVVSLTLAGVTVILHQLFPEQMVLFTSEKIERYQSWYGQSPRAVGSLVNPNTGAVVLAMAALFAMKLMRASTTIRSKLSFLLCIGVMLIAMVLTESRTGALSLGIVLMAMVVFSRSRFFAGAVIVAVAGVIVVQPGLFWGFWERIVATYDPEMGGQLGAGLQARLDTWVRYWEEATVQVWLFGQGRLVPTIQIGFHAHSTYVSALFIHGIGGVVWFLLFFGTVARRSLRMVRTRLAPFDTVGSAVLWGLAVWAIAGLTLDLLVPFNPRYVYLFYAVLIERGYALAKQSASASPPNDIVQRDSFLTQSEGNAQHIVG